VTATPGSLFIPHYAAISPAPPPKAHDVALHYLTTQGKGTFR
jgi:hypothetical protein